LIKHLLNIVISPSTGWLIIKGLEFRALLIFLQLVAPVVLFTGFIYSFSLMVKSTFWPQILLQLIFILFWSTSTIYLTSFILNRLSKTLKGQFVFNQTLLVSSLSFSIFFILWSFTALSTRLAIPLKVLSVYSLVVFYRGASVILCIPNDKLVGFTMLTAIILILCFTITGVLLSAIFQQPISF
jgi:hypothetical protein